MEQVILKYNFLIMTKKYYHFANFKSKEAAITEIDLFLKKGEEVYKYDPFRLRITDGEKEL